MAHHGCQLLAERFEDFASLERDEYEIARSLLEALRTKLELTAARQECGVNELASTYLAVATAANEFIAVHVGDGVIGAVVDGELVVVSGPDNGEFANQTTFVTSASATSATTVVRGSLDRVSGFILMSDGTAETLYLARKDELASACLKMVEFVAAAPSKRSRDRAHRRQLRQFLDVEVRTRTNDDCSIGLLARRLT